MYTIGPKPRNEQQVYIENPQGYIIPHSGVDTVLKDVQQGEHVGKKGSSKHLQIIMVVQEITQLSFGLQTHTPCS